MVRKSRGRQKLEMVKMPNESSLQVTFSKRRSGLFKKASELCTLCGVEVAIIVFSPGKKVYSFGHPSVESVMNHFITRIPPQTSGTMQLIEAHRNANICELNIQLTQVLNELETENKRAEQLNRMRKQSQSQRWWEAPIAELSPTGLADLKVSLQELKKQVNQQVEKIMIQSSAPYFPRTPSTEGMLQFDPKNTGFNLANNNTMPPPPPPPMIQSSTHPLEFPGSSSTGGIHQSDLDNLIGFNHGNMNMMAPPHMIQSSAPPQYFAGSSSNGGIFPLDPIPNNTNFNPSNMNMMHPPPPPPPHNHPQQPFQPLHFPPPQHSHPEFPPGVNHRFY